jgi:hypothetical protein
LELDPGPIEDDDSFNSGDPENCNTGTMCYDLVHSQLVPSDHLISAFQQGHQAFPLVKLKDNFTSSHGDTYHSFLPIGPVRLDHTFTQYPDLHLHTTLIDHFHATPSRSKHSVINMERYHFYNESRDEYSLSDEDLRLSTDEPDFDQYDFYYNLEELQEPPKMDNATMSNMQSPASQKWSYYLQDTPVQCDEEYVCHLPKPDCIYN